MTLIERLEKAGEGLLTPLADNEAVAALCDSSYRAGVLAGWNAATHPDAAKGEARMALLRKVEPGSLQPIIERNKAREALATLRATNPKGQPNV